jgi:hypothetical protein
MVPTVNDVALTGPDASLPIWARDPNPTGGYQLDARLTSLQQQAVGALTNHAQVHNAVPQGLLDDLTSFQRVLFTNHRVRALSDALRTSTTPLPMRIPLSTSSNNKIKAVAAPGVVPPVASTDGMTFDRHPRPEERAALLAYLRKL